MRRDTDVARQAAEQHGVVRRSQAAAAGLTSSAIHRRTEAGLLVPCHPGVVRVAGAPVTWRGDLLAAVLSAGDDAVASHRAAGALWHLDGLVPGFLELTVPLGYAPRRRGVIVHRAVVVDALDRTVIDSIPATRIEATLIALASVLRGGSIEDVVDSALVQGLTLAERVLATLDRLGRRGRRNAGFLAAVLERRVTGVRPRESRFERRLHALLVRAGLAEPVTQFEVRMDGRVVARPDLAYPDLRVAIEADSYRWHGSRSSWERDLSRRTELAAAGWLVLHFSWRDLVERPGGVVASVAAALDTRRLQI
jgi:very-short-patch-repair endonuclease